MIKRIAFLILALAGPVTAAAQGAPRGGTLPLAIVLVDELPFANAKAVLIRRKDMKPQNIVLVTKQTSPGDLTKAMGALFNSRRSKGDQIASDLVAPIAASSTAKRSRDFQQASRDLAGLRKSSPRFIEGVGSRPVVFSHLRAAASGKTR